MKLAEIIEMFAKFGMPESYVRHMLAQGDSAHNAFEGLKTILQLRWGEMCQELSAERQQALRPLYDRLMNIRMTSRTTQAQQRNQAKGKISEMFREMYEDQKKARLSEVFDFAAECAVREEERKKRRAAKKKAKKDEKHPDAIDVEYEEK